MAATATYDYGQDARGKAEGRPIKNVRVSWTSDSNGDASLTTVKIVGEVIKGVTIPSGAAAPTDNYDITITDEDSVNILTNCDDDLADRSTSATQEVYFELNDHAGTPNALALHPVVCSKLTVTIANAGDTKSGTLVLYYR